MGDPLGIGPEVLVRALADKSRRGRAQVRIHGFASAMDRAAEIVGVEPFWWRVPAGEAAQHASQAHDVLVLDYANSAGLADTPASRPRAGDTPGPTRASGAASFRFVEDAIAQAKRTDDDPLHADAIVTAPISKAAWAMAGKSKYPGHTELLATRFNARRTRMMFVADELRVILVTAHLPLMDLRNVLTIGKVHETIDLGAEACRDLGIEQPRIAVCGLNPHAGEGGLMGDEEARLIEPAIRIAQQQGVDASGPYPADTIFNAAQAGKFDLVVAMYHDQGLIPVKLLAFDRAVNATVGLPAVRTSPDHGTAYDIAWRGKANPGSMAAAFDLATDWARHSMGAKQTQ